MKIQCKLKLDVTKNLEELVLTQINVLIPRMFVYIRFALFDEVLPVSIKRNVWR